MSMPDPPQWPEEGAAGAVPPPPVDPTKIEPPEWDDIEEVSGAEASAPSEAQDVEETGEPSYMALDLNREQVKAVEAPGPIALTAPPGSGKTRTVAARICRILDHAAPQSVLAVTFTRYAAREMRDQLRRVVGDDAEDVNISTLHALGYGIVRAEADTLGLGKNVGTASASYAHHLMRKAAKAAGLSDRWDLDGVMKEIERAKGDLIGPEDYHVYPNDFYSQNVARVYRIYQDTLHERNLVDFADMIRLAVKALETNPEAQQFYQNLYRFVVVDEWQDTSGAQYRLVQALTGPDTDLFVVGDPLQSIYGWRGADPTVFQRMDEDFGKVRRMKLRRNYRNTETIAAASEGIVEALELPRREMVAEGGAGEPLTFIRCDTERGEAMRIVEKVDGLVEEEERTYNECAVLVRTVRQARLIEQAFLRRHTPYTLAGRSSFFDTRAVRELLAWMRLAANPFDEGALETAINAPPRGIGKVTRDKLRGGGFQLTMEKLLEATAHDKLDTRMQNAVAEFLDIVDDVQRTDRPPDAMLEYILDRTGYEAWLRGRSKGNGKGGNKAALHNLRLMLEGYPGEGDLEAFLEDVEQMQVGAERGNDQGVLLGTIHAAKGLEWPVVFLPGLDEGLLPHAKSLMDEKRLKEEHRLFYVALTRAMEKVYLLRARYRTNKHGEMWECRPSRFLGYLPSGTIEEV